jgi:hypothetical protein
MHTKVPSKWLNQETKAKFPRGASVPIWWKSALTMNQMLQFCVMITQAGFLLYNECAMPNKVITQVYVRAERVPCTHARAKRSESEGVALLRRKRGRERSELNQEVSFYGGGSGLSSESVPLRRKRAVERAKRARRKCDSAAEAGSLANVKRERVLLRRKQARSTKECPSSAEAGCFAGGLSGGDPPPAKCFARGLQSSLKYVLGCPPPPPPKAQDSASRAGTGATSSPCFSSSGSSSCPPT